MTDLRDATTEYADGYRAGVEAQRRAWDEERLLMRTMLRAAIDGRDPAALTRLYERLGGVQVVWGRVGA